MLSYRKLFRASIAAIALLASASSRASAALQSYTCKDAILNETAFNLWLDPESSTVVWRSTPVSFVPSQWEKTPIVNSDASVSWMKDYLGDKLAFQFDRKTGKVTVTRSANGKSEIYGEFSCTPEQPR